MKVLAFGAHPDDVEFRCSGTLALLADRGWDVAVATVTGGGGGSMEHPAEEIRRIRLAEAKAAADLLGAAYVYAGGIDMDVDFRHELRVKVVHVLRQVRPDVVITLPPGDYHTDHTETSKLVRAACFFAPIPNYPEQSLEPIPRVPRLYYMAAETDWYGRPFGVSFVVDISDKRDVKERMLVCHASQRNWIRDHHGTDDYVVALHERGAAMGARVGVDAGEGFIQHLGPGYPHDDPIGEALADRVRKTDETLSFPT